MSGERFAHGSDEAIEYRGRKITIWRTFTDSGRRIRRFWHFDTGTERSLYGLKNRTEAIWTAKRCINIELDGRAYPFWFDEFPDDDEWMQHDWQEPEPQTGTTAAADGNNREDRVAEWLRSVTVDNGFTPAEEATAKEKLAKMASKV